MKGIARKKPVDVEFEIATESGTIHTTEGVMAYQTGDYILTDPFDGRRWPVDPAYFERHYVIVTQERDRSETPEMVRDEIQKGLA